MVKVPDFSSAKLDSVPTGSLLTVHGSLITLGDDTCPFHLSAPRPAS